MLDASDRESSVAGPANSSGAGQPEESLRLLLRLFLDLRRGMLEFRRAYGLSEADSVLDSTPPDEILQGLRGEGAGGEYRRALERGADELMIHQASLLEAYQVATQSGTRSILDLLDPERLRGQVESGRVRVGPVTLRASFGPLLMQAVWEEFLRRFAELRKLDGADFERYFRDGFQNGYREFRAARRPQEP